MFSFRSVAWLFTAAVIMLTGHLLAQQSQKSGQSQKATKAKKDITPKPVDFSALTPFKDALLDLKASVKVGINREDYTRKLQTASFEQLKAEDRLQEDSDPAETYARAMAKFKVRGRFYCYGSVFSTYKVAAALWDNQLETDLQKSWDDAGRKLDECTTSGSPKPN